MPDLDIEPQPDPIDSKDLAPGDADDLDGWESESASHIIEAPADDTTAEDGGDPRAGAADDSVDPDVPDDAEDGTASKSKVEQDAPPISEDGDQVSASRADAQADYDQAEPEKPKKKDPAEQREARLDELQNRINEATWRYNETLRRTEALEARLRDAGQSAPAPQPGEGADDASATTRDEAPDPYPVAPNYPDFDDEASFKAAQAKWQQDVESWHERRLERREARLREELTGGLEKRLVDQQHAALAERANREYDGRLQAAKKRHEDFDDVAKHVASVRSSWAFNPDGSPVNGFRDPDTGRPVAAPFLWDVIKNTNEGPEILYWLGRNVDQAESLAEIRPSVEIRNAIIESPSPGRLMAYFASPKGREHFEHMKAMHPRVLNQHIGLLSAQMAAAPRDPTPPAPQPITAATPPARSPRGTPRAHAASSREPFDFNRWMAQEDEREGLVTG